MLSATPSMRLAVDQYRPLPAFKAAPDVRAHCEQCGRETGTVYLRLRTGMVANSCVECRRCRRGRPFVPPTYLSPSHNPNVRQRAATGDHDHAER